MNLTTLRASARFKVFGDRTNTAYSDTDLDANLNQAYRELLDIISRYSGRWQPRDGYATEDLLADTNKYALPTDVLRIKRVQIKPLNSMEDYLKAEQIDPLDIDGNLDTYKPETPKYDLRKNFITFYYDKDIESVTDGIKIWYDDEITALASGTDTTSLPEFANQYIYLRAAYEYLSIFDTNRATMIKNELGDEEAEIGVIGMIKKHYANRSDAQRPRITFKRTNYR